MPEKIWIKFYKQGKLSETITFSKAEKEINLLSKKFISKGIKKGDRIMVKLRNSIGAVITYLALKKLKVIAVPVNPEDSKDRISFIVENCSPKAVITERNIEILNRDESPYTLKHKDKIATIIYTSGTTGIPKGVCLSFKNWEENAKALIKHHGLGESIVIATPLPLFHCNAHGFGMYSTFISKSQLILFDKTPENFLEIVNIEKVNIVSVVPAILEKIFNLNEKWLPHPGFKYFLTAAAPLRADLLELITNKLDIKVVQGYGLSESTNFSCTLPVNLSHKDYKKVMFPYPSVGVALPGVKVEIDGNKERQIGQVFIKAKSNLLGYWGSDLKGVNVVETGDLGYFKKYNKVRFFYLKGRLKELINRGGEKIYPLELESELRSLGLAVPFQVFSIPDKIMGDEVGLATLKPFNVSILDEIPTYRRPKIVFLVDKFFFTPTGKVQRRLISDYCMNGKGKMIYKYERNN